MTKLLMPTMPLSILSDDAIDAAAILGKGEGREAEGKPVRLLERIIFGPRTDG